MPASTCEVSERLGGTPVRNRVEARAWTPAAFDALGGGVLLRPVITTNCFLNGSSGCRIGGRSPRAPSSVGVQPFMTMPLGTYTTPIRRTGRAADWASAVIA